MLRNSKAERAGLWRCEVKLVIKISRRADNGFRACCPALPGCAVYGRSWTEASDKIQEAVRGYLAGLDTALPRELSRLAAVETS